MEIGFKRQLGEAMMAGLSLSEAAVSIDDDATAAVLSLSTDEVACRKGTFLDLKVLQRIDSFIRDRRQVVGADVAGEVGMGLRDLARYLRFLTSRGRIYRVWSRRYPGGLWAVGTQPRDEDGIVGTDLRVQIRRWKSVPCQVDLAEALLFDRFPALTAAALLEPGSAPASIRISPGV